VSRRQECGLQHDMIEVIERVLETFRFATPPGRHRFRATGFRRGVPGKVGANRRAARRFEDAGAEGVRHRDVAASHRVREAGHADNESGRSSERIAEVVVEAAEDDFDGLQAAEHFGRRGCRDVRSPAFDERVAEVAAKVGVLEIGFVVGAGVSSTDAGVVLFRRGDGASVSRNAWKKCARRFTRQSRNASGSVAGHDDAVFERVAGAGGSLGAVGRGRATGRRGRGRGFAE